MDCPGANGEELDAKAKLPGHQSVHYLIGESAAAVLNADVGNSKKVRLSSQTFAFKCWLLIVLSTLKLS